MNVNVQQDFLVWRSQTYLPKNLIVVKSAYTARIPKTTICKGASISGGATILPGIKIGEGALIGAGAVVTKDVKPNAVVYGTSSSEKRFLNKSFWRMLLKHERMVRKS